MPTYELKVTVKGGLLSASVSATTPDAMVAHKIYEMAMDTAFPVPKPSSRIVYIARDGKRISPDVLHRDCTDLAAQHLLAYDMDPSADKGLISFVGKLAGLAP